MIPSEYVGWTMLLLDPTGSRILRCKVVENDQFGAIYVDPEGLEAVKSARMASPTPHMHRVEMVADRRWRRVPFKYPGEKPDMPLAVSVSMSPPIGRAYLTYHTKGRRPPKWDGVLLRHREEYQTVCSKDHWPLLIRSSQLQATLQLTFSWTD